MSQFFRKGGIALNDTEWIQDLQTNVCSTVYPKRNLRSWLESAVNI